MIRHAGEQFRPLLRLARLVAAGRARRHGGAAGRSGQPEAASRPGCPSASGSPHPGCRRTDRLETAGLIRRERAVDRRRVGVFLTDEGYRVVRSVRRRRTAWLAERLERLSAADQAAIEAAIGPLTRLLEVDA
jgi:hypothetical protein